MYIMKYSNREHNYTHKDNEGKFMDIDQNSGGYPYAVDKFNYAYIFTDLAEAHSYQKMFPFLDIHKVQLSLFPVEHVNGTV